MINLGDVTTGKIKKYNQNWAQISDIPYRILMIRGSGSGKTNALIDLIKKQDDVNYSFLDKIYWYVEDVDEIKYQYLMKKH